jgi:hypothetical protein
MCTFENEQSVVVCDSAIQQVRAAVSAAFGDGIRYTPIAGQGTRVARPTIRKRGTVSGSGARGHCSGAGEAWNVSRTDARGG